MIYVAAGLLLVGTFTAIRTQAFVGDLQLARSMIPHHSMAILNCEQAMLSDPETIDLCQEIIRSQRQEIVQMKNILERLSD